MKTYRNQIKDTVKYHSVVSHESTINYFGIYAENNGIVVEMDLHHFDKYDEWNIKVSINDFTVEQSEDDKQWLTDLVGKQFDEHLDTLNSDGWDHSERLYTEMHTTFNIQ